MQFNFITDCKCIIVIDYINKINFVALFMIKKVSHFILNSYNNTFLTNKVISSIVSDLSISV
jgi:hypothetical protein